MRVDDFDYELSDASIARCGVEPRDAARLLVVEAGAPPGESIDDYVEDRRVSDLDSLLVEGDVLVLNDTRVLPARVRIERPTGGRGELLLLGPVGDGSWECLARPSAKLSDGLVVTAIDRTASGDDLTFVMGADLGEGRRIVTPRSGRHLADGDRLVALLDRFGEMPLPPYLGEVELEDPDRYQTVFANRPASAAAPTAGLHLTDSVLERIAARGVRVVTVELVVGLGTFRPMTDPLVDHHVMHHEWYSIPVGSWDAVQEARTSGHRVVAVGTTSVRALESAAATGELVGSTDLFIRRPYQWQVVDAMMTNFHLPRSSLLVMIDAFVGPVWRDIYRYAREHGYRFLSFGDAMFISRNRRDAR